MTTTKPTWNTADLKEKGKAHLLNSVSNLKMMREHGPLVISHGEGVYLWDTDGKKYLDGFAGLWNVNIGHGRSELGKAMAEQVDEGDNLQTWKLRLQALDHVWRYTPTARRPKRPWIGEPVL